MRQLNHLDLFSGIGGFALAAKWAGFNTRAFCEIDPFCRKVLNKNFPDVPVFEDIKGVSGYEKEFKSVDVITAGFPCQPFSKRGHQKGVQDDRYLWPELYRVLGVVRPSFILLENVVNIVNLGIEKMLLDLGSANYITQLYNIPAAAVGAEHRRERLWILAYSDSVRLTEQGLSNYPIDKKTDCKEKTSLPFAVDFCKIRKTKPRIRRTIDGIPDRVDRVKALGNSIVPQIAYIFLNLIKESL